MTLEAKKIRAERPSYKLVQENAIPLPGEGDRTACLYIQKKVMKINKKLETCGILMQHVEGGYLRPKRRGRIETTSDRLSY